MAKHFVIAGAQRSGTTGVYKLLQQHPDICMAEPILPEPKFFLEDNAVQAGYSEYRHRLFPHHEGQPMLGEKSTSYMERIDAIPRLHAVLPDVKLVFVLRNPVVRAYSNWRFSRMHGLETLDFETALDAEKRRLRSGALDTVSVNPFAYVARGHYVRYLERWGRYFDRDRFILLTSEDIFADPDHIRGVFAGLGVRDDIRLEGMGRVNASRKESPPMKQATHDRLLTEFAESNARLRADWGVDVGRWS